MAQHKKSVSPDVALLYAPTDDGHGARVIRARDGALEAGEVRPVRDGQPINNGELVRLSPRSDAPCICDVEILHRRPAVPIADAEPRASDEPTAVDGRAATPRGRPAQVASDDYRMNWDRIFGQAGRRSGERPVGFPAGRRSGERPVGFPAGRRAKRDPSLN
jgi:hypothetical protein